MKRKTNTRRSWLLTVIVAIGLAFPGCAEKQEDSSWPLDSKEQSEPAGECDQGPLESVSLVNGETIQELFGKNVSREAVAVRVRGTDEFKPGGSPHMLKVGEVKLTRYTFHGGSGDRELVFMCEECRLDDLEEGAPVVYGRSRSGKIVPRGSTCFVYENGSFKVE